MTCPATEDVFLVIFELLHLHEECSDMDPKGAEVGCFLHN